MIPKMDYQSLAPLTIQESWTKDTGHYTYYGTYQGEPVKYRILADTKEGILLDCDIGLYPVPYHQTIEQLEGWQDTYIANSLTSTDFYEHPEIFTEVQKEAIQTISWDGEESYHINRRDGTTIEYKDNSGTSKITTLSGREAYTYYPVEEDRIKEGTNRYYWLRSLAAEEHNTKAAVIGNDGIQLHMPINMNQVDVSPSFYLDQEAIIQIWPTDKNKTDLVVIDESHYQSKEWTLTLEAGSGFSLERITGTSDWGQGGHQVILELHTLANGPSSVSYNQVSAILTDTKGKLMAYGSIHQEMEQGQDITIDIPESLHSQELNLYLFQEDTSGETHYSSNVVSLSIGEQGQLPVEQEDNLEDEPPVEPEVETNVTPPVTQTSPTISPSVTSPEAGEPEELVEEEEVRGIGVITSGGGTLATIPQEEPEQELGVEMETGVESTWYSAASSTIAESTRSIMNWFTGEDLTANEDIDDYKDTIQGSNLASNNTSSADSNKLGRARTGFTISLLMLTTQVKRSRKRKVKQLEIYRKNIQELI